MFSAFTHTKLYRRTKWALLHLVLFGLALSLALLIRWLATPLVARLIADGTLDPDFTIGFWTTLLATLVLLAFALHPLVFGLAPLWTGLARLLDAGRYALGGNARFAGLMEEYRADGGALSYGASLFSPFWSIGSRRDDENQHMLTIGGSGSGKGACVIIPNLLQWSGSAIVVDPKGTNVHVTANYLYTEREKEVLILDPFQAVDSDLVREGRPGQSFTFIRQDTGRRFAKGRFNPLDLLRPDDPDIAEKITKMTADLIIDDGSKEKYFINMPRTLIKGYIAHLMSTKDRASLNDLFEIIAAPPFEQDDIHAAMMTNTACGKLAQLAASEILSSGGTTALKNVYSTIRTQLDWLSSDAMKLVLDESNFDISDLATGNSLILFLVLPPDKIKTHRAFLRLVLTAAFDAHLKHRKTQGQTLFLIDEAAQLGRLDVLEQGFNLARSYRMVIWPFFQSKAQIDDLYGDAAPALISSSRAVQVFGVTGSDAEWVAQMLGTRGLVDDVTRTSVVMGLRDPNSIANEIGGSTGKQYILRRNGPHFLLERKPYYAMPSLAGKAGVDPDHPELTPTMRRQHFFLRHQYAEETIGVAGVIGMVVGAVLYWMTSNVWAGIFTVVVFMLLGFIAYVVAFALTKEEKGARFKKSFSLGNSASDWKRRFADIFDPCTGSHDNAKERDEVLSVFYFDIRTTAADRWYAKLWNENFSAHDTLSRYNAILGPESLTRTAPPVPAAPPAPIQPDPDLATEAPPADMLSWRQRFEAIFHPETGFHSHKRQKNKVWEEFEHLLDDLPDHKLATHWERKFGGHNADYDALLGPESTQEAAE